AEGSVKPCRSLPEESGFNGAASRWLRKDAIPSVVHDWGITRFRGAASRWRWRGGWRDRRGDRGMASWNAAASSWIRKEVDAIGVSGWHWSCNGAASRWMRKERSFGQPIPPSTRFNGAASRWMRKDATGLAGAGALIALQWSRIPLDAEG